MFFRVFFGATGGLVVFWTGMSLANDTFNKKLDRNVLKPIRNYR